MRIRPAFFLFVCFFFLVLPTIAAAEEGAVVLTADRQYTYARACFNEADYRTAVVEFKRFIRFFPGDPRIGEARLALGRAYFHLKEYRRAVKTFDRLISSDAASSDVRADAHVMKSRAFLMSGRTGEAGATLQNLLTVAGEAEIRDKAYTQLAVVYLRKAAENHPGALDAALRCIRQISPAGITPEKRREIENRIRRAKTSPRKNPVVAGIASIVPGGGYLYCGRYKDGLVSFLFNTALMVAAYTAFDDGNTALGGVITFVEAGFYAGNIYGSITSARKYNIREKSRHINALFDACYPFHRHQGNASGQQIRLLFQIPF